MSSRESGQLDNLVHDSLVGAHAHLAQAVGRVARYRADVASFSAVPANPEPRDWSDLARLLGPGALADLFDCPHVPPTYWKPIYDVEGLRMLAPPALAMDAADLPAGSELVELGPDDTPEMVDLVAATRPGPFQPRTPELGTYLGIRRDGMLVAMAGERLRPPGWTEISAVCTAPEGRGHGYASRLVQSLSARISARGERAFLHVLKSNTTAIDLYARLGFEPVRAVRFRGFEVP